MSQLHTWLGAVATSSLGPALLPAQFLVQLHGGRPCARAKDAVLWPLPASLLRSAAMSGWDKGGGMLALEDFVLMCSRMRASDGLGQMGAPDVYHDLAGHERGRRARGSGQARARFPAAREGGVLVRGGQTEGIEGTLE